MSNHINGGVYLLSISVFDDISAIFKDRVGTGNPIIQGACVELYLSLTWKNLLFGKKAKYWTYAHITGLAYFECLQLNPKNGAPISRLFNISKNKDCFLGSGNDGISLEEDIITKQAGQGKVFAFMNDKFWMSIKSAGSAVYANRVMLDLYGKVGISFINKKKRSVSTKKQSSAFQIFST